ncbi:MAG: V-type ATP synthase subunit I [bacterium]
MAVARLKKLLVAVHSSQEKPLLSEIKQHTVAEINPYIPLGQQERKINLQKSEKLTLTKKSLEVLKSYKGIFGLVSSMAKIPVKRSEFVEISKRDDLLKIAGEIIKHDAERETILSNIKSVKSEIHQLSVWRDYRGNLEDIGDFSLYSVRLGKINKKNCSFEEFSKELQNLDVSLSEISSDNDTTVCIVAFHKNFKERVEEVLTSSSFEESELKNYQSTVEENILLRRQMIDNLNEKDSSEKKTIRILMEKYEKDLTVYEEYLLAEEQVNEALAGHFKTNTVSFYTLWVKEKESEKVKALTEKFSFSNIMDIEPDEGEMPPILLENNRYVKNFEMVTTLFGVPRYFEVDPTPYISVFFAMFFGLCITDAVYGILLMAISAFAAYKYKNIRSFMIFMFFGGFWTMVMGALFSGWLGDLPSYIGVGDFFGKFALLGDPVNTNEGAMNFFRLSLLLGVIHIFFGLFIKLFQLIKNRDYAAAFFDAFVWILYIGSLVILFLGTEIAVSMQIVSKPLVSGLASKVLLYAVLTSVVLIVLFANRGEKNWIMRLFMGILNATIIGGVTAYVGDILSYIRLMALGLTSAGIGVAMNKIAFTMKEIPYVGIVFTIIIIIGGHLFNFAISLLGAFVHTMRLHFVEFFGKFYSGGGVEFRRFREEYKNIVIIDE